MIPLRAAGGNVLLRRVRQDGSILLLEGFDSRELQLAEVVGLGGRWNQDRKWYPPMPQQDRQRSEQLEREQRALVGEKPGVSEWKPMWRYPDSSTPYAPTPSFNAAHLTRIHDVQVGDLVVYVQARVYDHFHWEHWDILVYPGNWLYGVVTGTHLADSPERRRYEPQPV